MADQVLFDNFSDALIAAQEQKKQMLRSFDHEAKIS